MRQHFRLGRRSVGEAVAQNLGDAPMQHLPPALEKIFVGRILNKRVLEAVVGVRRESLDEQNIGVRELFQRGLQRRVFHPGERAEKAIGEATPNHRADLRYLSGRAKSVEPRHERLLQRRRDHVDAAFLAPFALLPSTIAR
jgi:hypothetical protein